MALSVMQIEKIFDEGYCLVDLLPYIEHKDNVFLLSDGSLGKVWKFAMYETEGKTEEYLRSIAVHMENILNRMPSSKIACQMILFNHRLIDERLNQYKDFKEVDSYLSLFSQGKIDHIHRTYEGFVDNNSKEIVPRKIDCYLTMRFFPEWLHPSIFKKSIDVILNQGLKESPRDDEFDRHKEEFNKYAQILSGALQVSGVHVQELCCDELMNWVYRFLNPQRSKSVQHIKFNEQSILRDQVLFNTPTATPYGLDFEEHRTRIVSIKELPSSTTMGMFSRELYEGTRFCLLDIQSDLMLVINFTVPPLHETMKHLNIQKSLAFMHKENWLGDKSIETTEKKLEMDETLSDLYKSGQKIANARIHLVIRNKQQGALEEDCGFLINTLNRLGMEGIKEDMIGASLFLTCLPLNFDPYYERFIRRSKRLIASNLSDIFPVYGSFQGTQTPAQLYLNRRGEIIFVDFFDSNINPHGVVIGASGSGKSFFMNDFILQNDRLGAHFFVLDKGDSYKKLNTILGGQYVSFDLNHPVRINPFINDPTPENLSFLMSLLSQMACGGDERDRLSREEEGLLQKAVVKAYEQRINHQELVLSDIVKILNDSQFNDTYGINSVMGPTLALRLTPFTQKGPYGGFFDGTNEFEIKGRFTVFELANLSAYPDLQLSVLLNLMFFMTSFVSNKDMRPKRKYLLIDEAWSLLKVKNTADFITNAFKTFRKYRCSVIAITQELADLTRHESGLAIIANASNKIFLKQESSLIDLLKNLLSLQEDVLNALKSVQTIKGKYSEAFVMTDSSNGIIRLVPDPFLYWAANSEPRNNELLLNKAKECSGDLIKAINLCAKEYPYGLK